MKRALLCAVIAMIPAALFVAGCGTTYAWKPSVPAEMRTIAVPTFRNESDVQELGAIMSRQTLREFQREGSFKICAADSAAVEVQGIVKEAASGNVAYDRRSGLRITSFSIAATVVVSVIDKRSGRVLIDNKTYKATASYATGQDVSTSERGASGRLAEEVARQVVDDVLALKF